LVILSAITIRIVVQTFDLDLLIRKQQKSKPDQDKTTAQLVEKDN